MTQTTSRPGALDTGTVNLSTGTVSFPISLASLPGRNGLDFNLSIQYSSGGIRRLVDTLTAEAPTGVLGLGWSFPQEKIVRVCNDNTWDSTYYVYTENTLFALMKCGRDAEGEIYESTHYQFWKIRYQPERELWMITKEDGTCTFYGGNVHYKNKTKTSAGNSIEWGVQWGNWTGSSNESEKQEQFPVAWNLACIEDSWGGRVSFIYEQDQQLVGTTGANRKRYTQACRLSQVIGATGEKIALSYGLNVGERKYEERVKQHTLPSGSVGPDAYQDRLERHYLDSLEVLNVQGYLTSHVQFRYASLGSGEMQKQILKAITRSNSQGHPYEPPSLFEYYGETSADGVSVSKTDASQVARGGALFGALKSVTLPQGATTSYQYTELTLPNARRDLDIPRPGNNWQHPLTYLGPDYAVVIWRGTSIGENQIHVTTYQWLGRWVANESTRLRVDDKENIEHIQVELAAGFFAVITPGQTKSVHLFSKDPFDYGRWKYSAQNAEISTNCLIASGSNFFVLLDQASGRLYRYTQASEDWNSFAEQLKTGTNTIFGLTAGYSYICTISAVPNNAFQPELRLYFFDDLGKWRSPLLCHSEPFFSPGPFGTTLDKLSLAGSTTFVSLLVAGIVSSPGNIIDRKYRLFAYHWIETEIKGEELKIDAMPSPTHSDETQLTVVGDMMIVGPMAKEKVVYQYTGTRWLSRVFKNDNEHNNYLGPGSFSTTEDGLAQYWQFNPNTSRWETGNIPPYKDGNPTLTTKFWSLIWPVISLAVGILTLPLGNVGMFIDLALLPLDLYSMLRSPDVGGGGHNGERFFTGDNQVYHQGTDGTWSKIGELLTDEEKQEKAVASDDLTDHRPTFETQELEFQNTQAASNFIAYAITRNRKVILKGGSQVSPAGYPKYVSKVQLLKNGAFRSAAILPEGEALQSSPTDETSLVGWNAFLAFKGGKTLRDATSLKLYRVIQDGFQGPLKDDVVSGVSVHDGYEETHIHYDYEAASAEISTGTTALYNRVTTIYSGASTTATRSNGYTESYFYVGKSGTLPKLPPDQAATNNSRYPTLMTGYPYYTRVCDGTGRQIGATTYYWRVFEKTLRGQENGYYLRQVKVVRESDGNASVVEESYDHQDQLDNGLPQKTVTYNFDVTGHQEKLETSYRYGWEIYPQLRDRHILSPVVQSTIYVNGIETSNQATTWLPTLRNLLSLTPGQELPPQFQGAGWSATDVNSVSVTASCPFPLGYASTRWEPEIPALTLISPFSGKLLFTYNCDVTVNGGWTWAELEVLVDGSKVWGTGRTNSHISETIAIDLSQSHQRVEWRVTNCGVEVERDETGHHTNHDARVIVSVRDIRMQDLQLLAPAATYQAKKPQGLTRPGDAPIDWLKTSTIAARNSTYGLVTEMQGVDAITSSVLYDTNYQFPVAHFVHASIENHEAGYYGFEDYENKALWQLTGTSENDSFTHSGEKAYSGRGVRIEPRIFTPRTSTTPYIVSAWMKLRSGGNGGQIGFGGHVKQLALSSEDWQYVEYAIDTPVADQKPFVSCDGVIDDFRYGPVDAPFSATVYDSAYRLAIAQLGTNGETVCLLYDDLQTLIAMTGPDGKEVIRLMGERHSRDGEKPFNGTRPNQKLSLLPRNGGRYYHTLSDYPGYKERHVDYIGGPVTYVTQRFTPTTANYGLKLRVSAPRSRRSESFFGILFGDRIVRCDASHTVTLTPTMPKASVSPTIIESYTPEHDPLDGSEWMLIVLGKRAFFFLDGDFLFSGTFSDAQTTYRLNLIWGPDEANIFGSDVFLLSDPVVELAYTDGLDRVIQKVSLDQNASGTIARQILYDGWGHPAITTKPLHAAGSPLAYQRDLVKTFDWNSGIMTGSVCDYYAQTGIQAPDQKPGDASYPYSRQVAEANPLARIREVTLPGVDFRAGSPLTIQTDFGRTTEVNALLADLNLTSKAGNYTQVTTRHPFDGRARSVTTQLFDRRGTLVAVRQGTGTTALTSTRNIGYSSDGTSSVTSVQPNAFPHLGTPTNNQYKTTTTLDFLGHPQASTDSDSNMQQCIYDRAGRLCFKLDAAGAAENPHKILYWKYDTLGRLLEEGIMRQQWDREQLQGYADTQTAGEEPSSFTPVLKLTGGIESYDLSSPNDQIIAFDYESSGKLDHLVLYRGGTGQITILKRSGRSFRSVYRSMRGIGGYDLSSPNDQIIAFDYESSGKLDHLVLYRPGVSSVFILKHTGVSFSAVYSSFQGVGGYNLASPNDQIIAFDYESSGKLDHLAVVAHGVGKILILKRSAGQIAPVDTQTPQSPAAVVIANMLKPYLVLSPADRGLAFDYEGSGKLDHLVLYAPGTGQITILKQGTTPVYHQPQPPMTDPESGFPIPSAIVPMMGIGGYDLKSPADRIIAFDYEGSGKLDHLVAYRPGTGAICILKQSAGQFTPVYFQGQPGLGIGGYNLKSPGDRIIAFDYESSSKLDHLVLYRPGPGFVWFMPATSRRATWKRRYMYDLAPNNETTSLKGRLCEVRTRDEDMQEVRETFSYDLSGNLVSTQLVVEAFDTQTRATHYEYDKHGNVTRIVYPYDLSGQPGFEVHYFYNINGQLASIGTADDPVRYATYEYDIEGRIKTERLNKQRLQYDRCYDFQGHLLSLKDNQGLFAEALRYRDASGTFKYGYVSSAKFTGSTLHTPYAYTYQYDQFGRLTAAQTVADKEAGIVAHPDWDVQGVDGQAIGYDENGNLLNMQQGQRDSTYRYKPGTNQLTFLLHDSTSQHAFGFEANEMSHFHTALTQPLRLGDWYCEPTDAEPITAAEKHSGTQSHLLGVRLFSPIEVSATVKEYRFTGWIRNDERDLEVVVCIRAGLNGPNLAEQTIGNTNGQWKKFECMVPDAGQRRHLYAYIAPKTTRMVMPQVYIDDLTFGPSEQEVYEHNQNGWIVKNGRIDAVQYDPHTALPVDIRVEKQSMHFRYGWRGQRVVKTTMIDGQNSPPEHRLYAHAGNAYPLTEKTRMGETIYIYGPGGIVAMCEPGQSPAFLLKDHLGSTRVVLDQENQSIAAFHYLPFGSLLSDNGNQPEATDRFRYLYTGQEYDEEIALYNYRARMYDSELGRFFTPDPKRQFPSPYVYVNNNPLNFTDPTGEMLLRALSAGRRAVRRPAGMGWRMGARFASGPGRREPSLLRSFWNAWREGPPLLSSSLNVQKSIQDVAQAEQIGETIMASGGRGVRWFKTEEEAFKEIDKKKVWFRFISAKDVNEIQVGSAYRHWTRAEQMELESGMFSLALAPEHIAVLHPDAVSVAENYLVMRNMIKDNPPTARWAVLIMERPSWSQGIAATLMRERNPAQTEMIYGKIIPPEDVIGVIMPKWS